MASYFEAVNNNNSILIDDTYSNYALWTKGTVVTSGWAGVTVGARVVLPANINKAYPIIALVHNGYVNLIGNREIENGQWRASFLLSDLDTSKGLTLEWYAFLPSNCPETNLKQTGMLCLWDENGKPLFDSNANYLRIVDFISVTYPNTVTKSYPSDRKYAVVVAVNQYFVRPAQSPGGWADVYGVSARVRADGNASYAYVRLRGTILGAPTPGATRNQTGTFMIIDVTGY